MTKRYNKFLLCLILAGLVNSVLPAQEDPAPAPSLSAEEMILDQYFPVEGLNQWQYHFDLKDLKEGTYNVIVQGRDAAGNLQTGEAVDFEIDPDSDLPTVSITYPQENRAIRGNLHILGSADDDDGVDFVEVKLGEGEYNRAQGTSYWSYTINTESLEDGEYTITCRSTDINGLPGKEQSVTFFIDRDAALIRTESHSNGDFVSGKFNVEGRAADLNGLQSMVYSLDGGATYLPASLKGKLKDGEADFSFNINSKELEDGALTVLMECTDLQGSTGRSSLLLYVDNTPPVLDIAYPLEEISENGSFSVMGRASDELGIATLLYTLKGGEAVEIPLAPGNPFWSFTADLRGEKQLDVQFELTDIAGNSTRHNLKRDLNLEADYPRLELREQTEGEIPEQLSGWITQSGAPSGLVYTIDGGEEISLEGGRTFSLPFSDLSRGEHTLTLEAVDAFGMRSEKQKKEIIIPSAPPLIEVTRYLGEFEEERPYINGGTVVLPETDKEKKETARPGYTGIEGTIFFQGGSGTAAYLLPDGTSVPLKMRKGIDSGSFLFTIPFPETMSTGFYPILIEATDLYGGKDLKLAGLWVEDQESKSGSDGIYPLNAGREGGSSSFTLKEGISFLYKGETAQSVELVTGEKEAEAPLKINETKGMITISPEGPCVLEKALLKVTDSQGKTHEYGPFTLSSDINPPEVEFRKTGVPQYASDTIELTGTVRDDLKITSVEYSLNGAPFKTLENSPAADAADAVDAVDDVDSADEVSRPDDSDQLLNFQSSLSLQGTEDGPVHLRIRATDSAGNTGEQEILLIKDSSPVQVEQILPGTGEAVNGLFTLMVNLKDQWSEEYSGEFIIAGESRPVETKDRQIAIHVDLAPYETLPEDIALIIRDSAGNETEFNPRILFDAAGDKPLVQIYSPTIDELLTTDSIFSGIVLDDDGVDRIEYRIDEGEFIPLPGGNSFEIPVSLSSLSDNTHTLEVRAYDLGGVVSDTASREFRVSLEVPRAEMLLPVLGTTHNGKIQISGTASDGNGIEKVLLSFDNGNSYKRAEGQEEWSYTVDSTVFVDGNYMILIRVVDLYGVEEIYSGLLSVDNTAPRLELSKPLDGTVVTDELLLQMRVNDELSVNEILYTLKALEPVLPEEAPEGEDAEEAAGTNLISELSGSLSGQEVILSSLDLTSLPAGRYNLSVFAYDDARNEVAQSRNIIIRDRSEKSIPTLLFPFEGASLSGPFTVEGRIEGDYIPEAVTLKMGGINLDVLETDAKGYFSRELAPEELRDGPLNFQMELTLPDGSLIKGNEVNIDYSTQGPWVKINSVRTGAYLTDRPWIEGTAGYNMILREGEEADKKEIRSRELVKLEYSLNNGKSFKSFRAREEWKFRLETGDLPDGPLAILVRAGYRNGEQTVSQVYVLIDETSPDLAILTPEEGSRLNDSVTVTGTAYDENGLTDVSVMLRKRSKSSHEIPTFIQGLYLDTHFLGATSYAFGLGLTFFDENVRLQALYGKAPDGRFNGNVFGLKLLANVATLPYGYFFGPDFDFLSSSLAVGSAFEYFTMTEGTAEQSGLVLGALLIQLELIKVEVESLKFFNAYSLYMEDQIWFISSDVQGGIENRIAIGLRVNIF
ncbi:MAG: Ig-like domain-containing protein [Spirochaetales bacterium]|nr:Ig-like domain-containing protein [Spirochaetales bacterium]